MRGRRVGQDFTSRRNAYKIYAWEHKKNMYFWKSSIDWRRILKMILKKLGSGCEME